MAIGRLAKRGVSWLDQAIRELAEKQAKQQPEQILKQLRKNPRVSQDEIMDRGLDNWLEIQKELGRTPIDLRDHGRRSINTHLQLHPVPLADQFIEDPQYREYSTRGLRNYFERVTQNPYWDNRIGSEAHFPQSPGYQYHTRGGDWNGWLNNRDTDRVRILDEVQSDIGQNIRQRFLPQGVDAPNLPNLERQEYLGNYIAGHTSYPAADLIVRPGEYDLDPRLVRNNLGYAVEEAMGDVNYHEFGYTVQDFADELQDLNRQALAAGTDYNFPARSRWQWQATARELERAADEGAQWFAWPDAQTQYRRYYGDLEPTGDRLGSLNYYKRFYDKELPRDKRWKQLGIKPEPINLSLSGIRLPGQMGKPNYWGFELTPGVLETIGRGLPMYGIGGAAILGPLADEEEMY